jgi:hypothetical protein
MGKFPNQLSDYKFCSVELVGKSEQHVNVMIPEWSVDFQRTTSQNTVLFKPSVIALSFDAHNLPE